MNKSTMNLLPKVGKPLNKTYCSQTEVSIDSYLLELIHF